MTIYRVEIHHTSDFEFEVEASTEDEAREVARCAFEAGESEQALTLVNQHTEIAVFARRVPTTISGSALALQRKLHGEPG